MAKKNTHVFERFYNFEHTIRSLKKENLILRAEIKRLSQIIKANESELDPRQVKGSRNMTLWQVQKKEAALLSSPTYIKYLISTITGGSLFALSKKAVGYFRKFKLASTFMRIISSALAIIGTGAFFIFISGAVVFIVPFAVAFSAALYFLGAVWRTRAFKLIDKAIQNKAVYVFFPTREKPFQQGSAFRNTLNIISNDTESSSFIIVVSPYVFSSVGFSDDKPSFYPIIRFEKSNVCILRKYSFFLLRKKILGPSAKRVHYIY